MVIVGNKEKEACFPVLVFICIHEADMLSPGIIDRNYYLFILIAGELAC
jgi:hypothetical protein